MKTDRRGDRGRDVFEAGAAGVERELRRLVPAAVPPGLRGRVVARAAEARRGALLAPWMRVAATVCSLLIVAALGFDTIVGRHETDRLMTLLDGRVSVAPSIEGEPEISYALIGRGTEAELLTRLRTRAAVAMRKNAEQDYFEARRWLKGWLAYESSENPD